MPQITLRTNFTPTLTFDPTKKDTRPIAGAFLKLLKPSLDANIGGAFGNIHFAPYGEPNGMGEFALIGIFLLAIYGGIKLVRGKL